MTGEQGPAHKKRFTVTLKLGDEEYSSDGASIKKAQHLAAAEAVAKTQYKHPPAKSNRARIIGKIESRGKNMLRRTSQIGSLIVDDAGTITPTVELNALAMKRGEPAVYVVDVPPPPTAQQIGGNQIPLHGVHIPPQQNQFMPPNPAGYNSQYGFYPPRNNPQGHFYHHQRFGHDRRPMGRGGYSKLEVCFNRSQELQNNVCVFLNQRYQCPYNYATGTEEPCKVTLQVGQRKFVGIGSTLQSARHDAASKYVYFDLIYSFQHLVVPIHRALEVLKPITPDYDLNDTTTTSEDDINSELKSPISLVHEMALKRNLIVTFDVISEKGPPHMKIFVTGCTVGDITVS